MLITYDNSSIAYTDSLNGDITLLFIHGSFINKEYWDEQVKYFSPTYRVIALDLPGHGASEKSPTSLTAQHLGNAVTSVVENLKLKNVILIGHSVGGDIALETAINIPDAIVGFIVVDYFKNPGTPVPEDIVDQTLAGLKADFKSAVEYYVKNALTTKETDPGLTNRIVVAYQQMDPKSGIEAISDLFTYTGRQVELLRKLKLPVYLINVDYAPTNEEQLKKFAVSGYELLKTAGTSHYPMIEEPEALTEKLEWAIDKISKSV